MGRSAKHDRLGRERLAALGRPAKSTKGRKLEAGPGFIRAKECPDCFHTKCSEECVCNCDAARAEDEAAHWKALAVDLAGALQNAVHFLYPGVVFGDMEHTRRKANEALARARKAGLP